MAAGCGRYACRLPPCGSDRMWAHATGRVNLRALRTLNFATCAHALGSLLHSIAHACVGGLRRGLFALVFSCRLGDDALQGKATRRRERQNTSAQFQAPRPKNNTADHMRAARARARVPRTCSTSSASLRVWHCSQWQYLYQLALRPSTKASCTACRTAAPRCFSAAHEPTGSAASGETPSRRRKRPACRHARQSSRAVCAWQRAAASACRRALTRARARRCAPARAVTQLPGKAHGAQRRAAARRIWLYVRQGDTVITCTI